jgi:hypothetical protein
MKNKLFKDKKSGNVYTCLGIINHKDEVTREWVEHIFYTGDETGVFFSRTKEDFMNNFEEIKV